MTVLFSDVCGSSRLADTVDPEVTEGVLEQVIGRAVEVIHQHGGVVNQCHGDGVLAVFGFPRVQEDDVRRATEAALDLHEAVSQLVFPGLDLPSWFRPRMHSGIDAGLVVIGGGDWIQGQYKVTGPAANTAARLSQLAGTGEILASASTLKGVLPYFQTFSPKPIPLKNSDASIPVYRVTGRADVANRYEARARRGLTAFFGRQAELRQLEQALAAIAGKHGQVVAVTGSAGIGKTRLIEEFLRRHSFSRQVFRAFCESYGDVAPLQPFLQMVRQSFRLSRQLSSERACDELSRKLAALGPDLVRHQAAFLWMLGLLPVESVRERAPSPRALVEAMADLLRAMARGQELLLVIDDWQWADDASRQVLGGLVEILRDAPVLVLLASREAGDIDLLLDCPTRIELGPFSQVECIRTIRALLPNCADSEARAIQRQSGGNALFIEELCESTSWRVVERTGGGNSLVPDWLYGLIGMRLEQLPPDQAAVVRTAAVIGSVVPAWLLERICGCHEQDPVIHQLASRDILASGERSGLLRFKHGLTRDAVYELVSHREKRTLHLRIARAIEQRYGPARRASVQEVLAYHYAGGGDYPRAYAYARRAGDKALAKSALDSAREQYMAALQALDRLEPTAKIRRRWLDLAFHLALASVYGPGREQLQILVRAAEYAEALGDRDSQALTHYWLGYLQHVLGEQSASIGHCETGLQLAEAGGNRKLAAQLRATLGQNLVAAGRYGEAGPLLDGALREKSRRSPSSSLPVGSIYAMSSKAVMLADRGDFRGARACLDWALGVAGGTGHEIEGTALNMQGAVLCWQGHWEEVVASAGRAREIAARVYAPYLLAMAHSLDDYAGFQLDGDRARVAGLKRVCLWLEERGIGLFLSFVHGWLADACATLGDYEGARDFGERALARAAEQDRVGEAMACRALARVAATRPQLVPLPDRAYYERALACAEYRQSPHERAVTQWHMARRQFELGDTVSARRLLGAARSQFIALEMVWHGDQARRLGERMEGGDRALTAAGPEPR